MTNAELGIISGAIITGLGGIGAVVRTGLAAIADSMKETRAVLLSFVATAARLEVKLDQAAAASVATKDAVGDLFDEVTGTHELPVQQPEPKPKRRTAPRGIGIVERHRTQGEGGDR